MIKKQSGFTLIEALFSMFIVFMTLGSLAYTLSQAANVKTTLRESGSLSEIVHTMATIRNDVAATHNLVAPASGTANRLELERFDPTKLLADRIDDILDFEAFDAADLMRVEYYLNAGRIYRRTSSGSAPTLTAPLVKALNFQVEPKSGGALLEIQLVEERERVTKTHQFVVRVQE